MRRLPIVGPKSPNLGSLHTFLDQRLRRETVSGPKQDTQGSRPPAEVAEDPLTTLLNTFDDLATQTRQLAEISSAILQTEDAIRSAEREYRSGQRREAAYHQALVEAAPDAILTLTPAGRILEMNRAAEQLLAARGDECRGRRLGDFAGPEGAAKLRALLKDLQVHPVGRIEDLSLGSDGVTRRRFEISASLVEVPELQSSIVVAIARDVTVRRRLEEHLRKSEERFRNLVSSTDDVIFTLDVHGRFTEIYGRALGREGLSPESLLGKTVREIVGDAAAQEPEAAIARVLLGQNTRFEWAVSAPEGRRNFLISLSPLNDLEGQVIGIVGFSRDMTDLRRLQAQLLVADRMASVGTLAAGVAHEINNPLAAIMANVDYVLLELPALDQACSASTATTLRRASAKGLFSDIADALQEAREASTQVRRIVRDLRVFSRAEEEKLEPVDVQKVLETATHIARNEIRQKAELHRSFARVPPIHGNAARLGQVLLNLLINAAQAIPEGAVQDNAIHLRIDREGDGRVVIEVSDTGEGISPGNLSRIFDPFFTTKPVGVGTGLGLSISHQLVRWMGGDLQVESDIGKGTTFRVLLCVARDEEQIEPGIRTTAASSSRRGRILVIDDEAIVATAVQRTLAQEHEVVGVTTATDALKRIEGGEAFDVILCDLMMPQMTGMDLHAQLRRLAPKQAERMVFVTGGAFTPRAKAFLSSSTNYRLEKPFGSEALRAFVNERLREFA